MVVQQDKIAYVTGSSRGIGNALVQALINEGYFVYGLARSNDFVHEKFEFIELDLNNLNKVKSFVFNSLAENNLLVNNAGSIGEIKPVGSISNDSIEQVMNVNTLAPQILINNYINRFKNENKTFHILNISSGAGKRPISSWASYCASKAAIDLFSETVAEELDWKGMSNWHIHSCAPGVVDTQMQVEIRSSIQSDFKSLENFKSLKENGELVSPEEVVQKLMQMVKNPEQFSNVVTSVRDF
ncbi:SDR family NAD(P)-dependent oxidoreductase [Paracrocinitomix mangrovi]|uniref:SDR family NAD(P)-dependent oxidoreductase n=1 Tax=Paracrocinitomix mangrovi TaxID=2862509 RepID=UPI001C8D8E50|nr:SDR family NAD(P)-dependent oxidoreductase [Paracrocinitomix mangrovi]UKN00172.1 SDR family NAD(P)-dependent oxidoreductase [Paracrocinitomix mangrovi]